MGDRYVTSSILFDTFRYHFLQFSYADCHKRYFEMLIFMHYFIVKAVTTMTKWDFIKTERHFEIPCVVAISVVDVFLFQFSKGVCYLYLHLAKIYVCKPLLYKKWLLHNWTTIFNSNRKKNRKKNQFCQQSFFFAFMLNSLCLFLVYFVFGENI